VSDVRTADGDGLSLSSAAGRGLLAAATLGSGMAFLDSTVVNVALPTIGRETGAGLDALQWIVNGYTLTLAALILVGGSLGDRFGRRKVFVVGVVWFAVASAACALAPSAGALVAARALQGVGGALMTPGSLAMIQASLRQQDRARAIGLWSGLSGVAGAVGPFVGGLLIAVDWRLVFWINVPLAVVAAALALRCAPESRDECSSGGVDLPGAVTGALALGASAFALVSAPGQGASPAVVGSAVLAVVSGVAFVVRERRTPHPMVPPSLFADRVFTVANILTLCVYAALGGLLFLLVLQLQVTLGWTPLQAGLATLPITVLLTLFSGRAGALAQRTGPRLPLTVGPVVAAAGAALLAFVGPGDGYVIDVLPGVLLFGLGLVTLVAPLTAAVMAAAPPSRVGVASGVNNAVARAAGLLAVAALPALVGLGGQAWGDPATLTPAYRDAALLCAGLLAVGGVVALVGLHDRMRALSPGPHAGLTVPHHDPCP
jgi:EmrB/QacA subfamily drug resistance transporter